MPSGSSVGRSFEECTAISISPQHRGVDLLREQAFAAGFAERAILDEVAAGLDDDDLEGGGVDAMRAREPIPRLVCLHERERRSAGSDTKSKLSHAPPQAARPANISSANARM